MPYCLILNFQGGELDIIEYPEGDDRDIEEWLAGMGYPINDIEYMCVEKLKIQTRIGE